MGGCVYYDFKRCSNFYVVSSNTAVIKAHDAAVAQMDRAKDGVFIDLVVVSAIHRERGGFVTR